MEPRLIHWESGHGRLPCLLQWDNGRLKWFRHLFLFLLFVNGGGKLPIARLEAAFSFCVVSAGCGVRTSLTILILLENGALRLNMSPGFCGFFNPFSTADAEVGICPRTGAARCRRPLTVESVRRTTLNLLDLRCPTW